MNPTNLLHLWKPAVEIAVLWFVIYHFLLFFIGTRAVQVLRGIIVLAIAFFIFDRMDFQVLTWLLTKLFGISIIAALIIFHPEIRQGLARLGQHHIFGTGLREEELNHILSEIAKATDNLARNRLGALIAIEKDSSLSPYTETGVTVDAKISADLIEALFTPNNPLHDGGIIIQNGRIVSAGCLFPLTHNQDLNRIFGTRHRAALGLSEETDALIIIVSEERHDITLVYNGKLIRDLSQQDLIAKAKDIITSRG